MTAQPTLPYNGTTGYVNRAASRLRAVNEAASGVATERQRRILQYLHTTAGAAGATWREVGEALSLHHGQVSAALSVLHRNGAVFQARHMRKRCHPYVHDVYRFAYRDADRHDAPTRTSSGDMRQRLEQIATDARSIAADDMPPHVRSVVERIIVVADGAGDGE